MINLSSAMGGQFAFSAAELTAEIQRLGPNPLGRLGSAKRGSSVTAAMDIIARSAATKQSPPL